MSDARAQSEFLQQLVAHRAEIKPPTIIQTTADVLYRSTGRDRAFLDTNCHFTSYAARDLLTPGAAVQAWQCVTTLPPGAGSFEVVFGEWDDALHSMFVHDGFVYQSYAFKHTVRADAVRPDVPWWQMVSHNAEALRAARVAFVVPRDRRGAASDDALS